MSRIFVKSSSKFLDVMRHKLIHIKFHPETLKLMCEEAGVVSKRLDGLSWSFTKDASFHLSYSVL